MTETVTIYPDLEKLTGISPYWDDEKREVQVLKTDIENIKSIVKDFNIKDRPENLCYILILLKQEKVHINLKENNPISDFRLIDRLEVSSFIQLLQKEPDINIKSIKFDLKKEYEDFEDQNLKRGSFKIQNPIIISKIWKIIEKEYVYKSSKQDNFRKLLRKQKAINKPTVRRKELANNIYRYLTNHTKIGENRKYFIIGILFQKSELENGLSEKDFESFVNNYSHTTYKNYLDFVSTRIRNKYFKEGRK